MKEMRERSKETVKATERRNRGSGKVRVRQLTVRVNRVFVYEFVCLRVCVGVEEIKRPIFCACELTQLYTG